MRDLVRVRLFVDAVEGHSGEARRLRLVEIGIRHQPSAQDGSENHLPEHKCMVAALDRPGGLSY
jgi:hypothetical protein